MRPRRSSPSGAWSRWLVPVLGHKLLCSWLAVTHTTKVSRQLPSSQTEALELFPLYTTPAYRQLTANDCLLQDRFSGSNSHSRAAAQSDTGISLSCFLFSFSYLPHSFPSFSWEYHPNDSFSYTPVFQSLLGRNILQMIRDPKNLLLIA